MRFGVEGVTTPNVAVVVVIRQIAYHIVFCYVFVKVDITDEVAKSCKATVPDDQLSLAIGNKGQNARLAARLTGWRIDIRPESGFYGEDEEEETPAEEQTEE